MFLRQQHPKIAFPETVVGFDVELGGEGRTKINFKGVGCPIWVVEHGVRIAYCGR